uniref:Glyceraldehyde-3-phosphate dehydrogenase n=1 Tax=Heyndrickxia coagulans TaxID=1398 RepID=G3P_HEYCO|nr:RecName: Full=Glyceraldehyde-3-phosphate dehydrogenase; Short=GAPDH; AltName: Full=NAD-dependent glyceraldehyde-3-phosphate dehydrogenase [Heyndrickxia coagulans]
MAVKVGINGFGRIGRNVFRAAVKNPDIEVVAVNDLTANADGLAHLLKYDSVHGRLDAEVVVNDGVSVNGKEIIVKAERNPENLAWGEIGVDIVVESTGRFTKREDAAKHLEAGAKKVIISAPAKVENITVVMGVNQDKYDADAHHVISNASCTTICLAAFARVLHQIFGEVSRMMTTAHSYTNIQRILDAATHADLRGARAAAESIIDTTNGAAMAVALVLPELKGKLNGMAMRVATANVSVVDLVYELAKEVTVEEVNAALKAIAEGELKGILAYSIEPLVIRNYNGSTVSSTIDILSTMVIDGAMVKVVSWYDNETGYSHRVVALAAYINAKGL